MNETQPMHPGEYIRKNVLPAGLSVTAAAKLVGVSRPTLSNLLNGNASLSSDMAVRLEKAFSVERKVLLDLQHTYDDAKKMESERQIAVRTYTPAILQITARDIEAWSNGLNARAELAELLRRLVHSTADGLEELDFPSGDNSQRPGWDGWISSAQTTPWIPIGKSGWEFGCNKNPSSKANGDYKSRTKNTAREEKSQTVFVFVTPRSWPEKDDWLKKKKAENEWKDVRALDANDLEQWLQTSLAAQVWLANRVGKDTEGCDSLKGAWEKWSSIASPPISTEIFESEVATHEETLVDWLRSDSPNPLLVTAASREEALAFVCAAASSLKDLDQLYDTAVVLETEAAVTRLKHVIDRVIPVTTTPEAEKCVAAETRTGRRIVISERRNKTEDAGIHLSLPTYEAFEKGCHVMGLSEEETRRLSRASAQSPTILRRLLSISPDLRHPKWATNTSNIKRVIPLIFAGTWSAARSSDKEILSFLSGEESYNQIEEWIAELSAIDDAPIWSESSARGVVSRLECLNAVSDHITSDQLDRFFFIAELILSEDNPALDLEKEQRWAAGIYEKTRDHSQLIRDSVADNLILLSLFGQRLFGQRIGYDVELRVEGVINNLLKNQSARVWQAQQKDLPRYAEAAPATFLEIVESELRSAKPAFEVLFEPASTGPMSSCDRTGMLWALELLAWKPEYLTRAILCLAHLCSYRLDDNWSNKPSGSIRDILLSWQPHTSADIEHRHRVITLLCERVPEVGWEFCMDQLSPFPSSTSGTYRPRWRDYASGSGKALTYGEIHRTCAHCLELALSWHEYTLEYLKDLTRIYDHVPDEDRARIYERFVAWLSKKPVQAEIADLREHVRQHLLTRRAKKNSKKKVRGRADAKKLFDALELKDVFDRHRWLFVNHFVEFSADELDEGDLDFEARDKALQERRIAAIKEILNEHGYDGIRRLCDVGDTAHLIGWFVGRSVLSGEELLDFAVECLQHSISAESKKSELCLGGVLQQFEDSELVDFLAHLCAKGEEQSEWEARLFLNAPFRRAVWDMVDGIGGDLLLEYWSTVHPDWAGHTDEDVNLAVRKLLSAERPRSALSFARLVLKRLETETLVDLLTDVGTKDTETSGHYRFNRDDIERAFKVLNSRSDRDFVKLAGIEQIYAQVLGGVSEYKFPNISLLVADSPFLFFQYVAMSYRRNDRKDDAAELDLPTSAEQRENAFTSSYRILDSLSVIPGTDKQGRVDVTKLRKWIRDVRELAVKHDRVEVTDSLIGGLLQKSPEDKDGTWPCRPVRIVLEEIGSKKIAEGMSVEIHNSRGVHWRPDHGGPERELAEKYRTMAEPLLVDSPYVASILLSVADEYAREARHHDAVGRAERHIDY